LTDTRWPAGVTAARDAFVLLAGFAGALRRSELAVLRVGDLFWNPDDGLYVRVRALKTDQEGVGPTVVLPFGEHPATCPPCALLRWAQLLGANQHGPDRRSRRAAGSARPAPTWPQGVVAHAMSSSSASWNTRSGMLPTLGRRAQSR
jgi:hypothetical protein